MRLHWANQMLNYPSVEEIISIVDVHLIMVDEEFVLVCCKEETKDNGPV